MKKIDYTQYNRVGNVVVEVGETTSSPLTWNEAINAMSAEEKAKLFESIFDGGCPRYYVCGIDGQCNSNSCKKCLMELKDSPYDGAQEGAEYE